MKSLIVAVLIATAIIFGGIYSTKKLSDLSETLITMCEEAGEAIENDDFKSAGKMLEEIEKSVEDNYNVFAVSIDHNEIDEIEMNIYQMQVYIDKNQKADALAFGNVLLGLFEHLPKDYRLKIENIL